MRIRRKPKHYKSQNGTPDWWSYSRYSDNYTTGVDIKSEYGYADSRVQLTNIAQQEQHNDELGPYYQPHQPYQPHQSRHRHARRPYANRPHTNHPVRNFFVVIAAALVAIYLVVFVPIDRAVAFDEQTSQELSSELSFHIPLTPTYVLLLGSDAREGDTTSRTDTMILAHIDGLSNTITLISIPRDTLVDLEEYGQQKINAAYAFGGAALSVQAVETLTGASISQVAVIDFGGLSSLVDAIGGITVTVPVDVNDPDYTGLVLSAGTYDMDGQTALDFSRVRHGFALGDYQRQEDQRIVIEAIIDKLRSNPLLLASAASSLTDSLSTTYRCYDVLPLLIRMTVGTPTVYAASIPSTTATIDGISYVIANAEELAQMMYVVQQGGDPTTVANGLE